MGHFIKRLRRDETGSTTVDWLVLTAGIVLLGAAISASLGGAGKQVADDTSTVIEERPIGI